MLPTIRFRLPKKTSSYPVTLVAQLINSPPTMQGRPHFDLWVVKILWRRVWQPTPVFLPGESPWTVEAGGPQSLVSQRVRHDWATKHTHSKHMSVLIKPKSKLPFIKDLFIYLFIKDPMNLKESFGLASLFLMRWRIAGLQRCLTFSPF